jgi:uncharacterized protein (DUF488 family)
MSNAGTTQRQAPDAAPPRLWTIGHSTRPIGELTAMLDEAHITALADVRRYPGSRRHPHYGRDALAAVLEEAGIEYLWLPELGGRREPRRDSLNTAWRTRGFRGYADYMETAAFRVGVARLLELARATPTAMMCAEQAWQHCHRGLIADYLKATGVQVLHIVGPGRVEEHPYTEPARIVDGRLGYDEDPGAQCKLDLD